MYQKKKSFKFDVNMFVITLLYMELSIIYTCKEHKGMDNVIALSSIYTTI